MLCFKATLRRRSRAESYIAFWQELPWACTIVTGGLLGWLVDSGTFEFLAESVINEQLQRWLSMHKLAL